MLDSRILSFLHVVTVCELFRSRGGGGTDQDSICIAMSLKAGKLSKGFKSSLYVALQGCPLYLIIGDGGKK